VVGGQGRRDHAARRVPDYDGALDSDRVHHVEGLLLPERVAVAPAVGAVREAEAVVVPGHHAVPFGQPRGETLLPIGHAPA
jgi:hypothetical protein